MHKIPITVFTGYLGSGKTTIILNLIKQLDPGYKVVWLKNEYGNLSVDSELAREQNIQVKEMLNGCLCCVLVGKLRDALQEIIDNYSPDRIIIESSGTAYPMPIVFEIKRLPGLVLDGVINVVDALNFTGYKDKGYVAKLQSNYTDLIIINKVSLVDDQRLDTVLDDIYELNPTTPKIKTNDGNLAVNLLFGLDSKLLEIDEQSYYEQTPQDHSGAEHDADEHAHPDFVDTFVIESVSTYDKAKLEQLLEPLKDKDFIRIKGIVQSEGKYWMLNWVFGRLTWQELTRYTGDSKIVFMGKDITDQKRKVEESLDQARS